MNIFIIGAISYVGNGIAQTLKQAGHALIGLVCSEGGQPTYSVNDKTTTRSFVIYSGSSRGTNFIETESENAS